jgi:hypothetical protein
LNNGFDSKTFQLVATSYNKALPCHFYYGSPNDAFLPIAQNMITALERGNNELKPLNKYGPD